MKTSTLLPLGLVMASFSAFAQTYPYSATLSKSDGSTPVQNTDFFIYTETTPGVLTLNAGGSPVAEMQGIPGNTGGNVELFANSDSTAYLDPSSGGVFANAPHVQLATQYSGQPGVVFSSLNGSDWFNTPTGYDTSYGANNLANTWWSDFMTQTAVGSLIPTANRAQAFAAWTSNGGFSRLSDPNVAYAYYDSNGTLMYGLGSFLDDSPRIREFMNALDPSGYLASQVPDGIQMSEVVLVNGVPTYQFQNNVASGVVFNDGVNSYAAVTPFSSPAVPEPSGFLMVLASLGFAFRRRRA